MQFLSSILRSSRRNAIKVICTLLCCFSTFPLSCMVGTWKVWSDFWMNLLMISNDLMVYSYCNITYTHIHPTTHRYPRTPTLPPTHPYAIPPTQHYAAHTRTHTSSRTKNYIDQSRRSIEGEEVWLEHK